MYRKLLISALALLALVSCTKETAVGDVEAHFCAYVDMDMADMTKSGGEAEAVVADRAVLQAWRGDVMAVQAVQSVVPGQTVVNFDGVKLAAGVEYDVYIMVYNDGYYDTSDLRSVSLDTDRAYDGRTAQFDAFCSYISVICGQDDAVHPVTLRRPFAKVSFSAEVASNAQISFSAPTTLNLKTGELSLCRPFSYTVQPEAASVAAFDYVLASEDVSHMSYTFRLGVGEAKTIVIPIRRNMKTNVMYNVNN